MSMNRRSVLAVVAGVLALALGGPGLSQPQWEVLGSKRIDVRVLEDTIPVAAEGIFAAVGIRVRGNELFIESVRVVFANGETADLAIAAMVPPGDETREIDLAGNTRVVSEVVVSYRRPANLMADRTVEVWGRR